MALKILAEMESPYAATVAASIQRKGSMPSTEGICAASATFPMRV